MYFLSPCDAIIISCQSLMASSSIIIGYQDPGAGAFVFSHILHYPLHLHSFVASIWAIISMLTYRSRPCTDILALGTSSTRVDKSPEGSLGSHSSESESEEE
jgi:hypothetical protein